MIFGSETDCIQYPNGTGIGSFFRYYQSIDPIRHHAMMLYDWQKGRSFVQCNLCLNIIQSVAWLSY